MVEGYGGVVFNFTKLNPFPIFVSMKILALTALLLLLVGCSSLNENTEEDITHDYTLKIEDENIPIDSVNATVWFEKQMDKFILTLKIYCTSGYPLPAEEEFEETDLIIIHAQSIAEPGTHFIRNKGNSWLNEIYYTFSSKTSKKSGSGKIKDRKIYIPEIDFDQRTISCKVVLGEFVSYPKIRKGILPERKVVFEGQAIPFTLEV